MSLKKFDEITKLSLMNFFLNLFFLSPVAVFFYKQRGLNYFQILTLESVLVLFIFFFEVPTGMLADKFGRKKSIVIGTFLLLIEQIIFLFARNFIQFAIAFAVSGIGLTFLSGTVEALMYDYLKKQKKEYLMKKAMGTYGAASLLAMVVAPPIGSFIAKDLLMSQFIFLIYLTIGAMFLGFVTSLLIRDTKEKGVSEENPINLLKEGISLMKKNKSLLRIVLLSMLSNPFYFVIAYLYQPYFKISGVNTALFGTIFAVAMILSAIFKKNAYKLESWLGMKDSVLLVTMLPGIFYILMAFIFNPILAVLFFIILMGTMGLKSPLFSQYKNIHIPSKNRATVLSLISMLVGLYLVIMRLIIGRLADINLNYAFVFMGSIIIASSILLRIDERHISTSN